MYFVYFLRSNKDGYLYIGRTNDVNRRLREHNAGLVSSTKSRRPLALLGYEIYSSEVDSVNGEREWKKGYKREELRKRYNLS